MPKLSLNEFKVVKNRQRPDFCYAYERYSNDKSEKYSIFTMNGGVSFLASITSRNNLGRLVEGKYSQNFNSVNDALDGINGFLASAEVFDD